MSTDVRGRRRGVVLIMVTFAMFVLCGMLGLVVDLGWSYFVRKSAQAAADAAALAAVRAAQDTASELADYSCGVMAQCEATPRYCSEIAGGNLKAACDYARLQGFTDSAQGRQRVSVQAYDRSGAPTVTETCGQGGATVMHAPTTGCVDTHYWVTVRIQERIPQLFSAMLGNVEGTVSARATAGVAQVMIQGSLILINREMDPWKPHLQDGINLYVGGTPEVTVPGGILIASTAHGPRMPQDPWAGFISGSGTVDTVDSPTVFRGEGHEAISGGGEWLGDKEYGGEAGFDDPMKGKGQPPLTSTVLTPKGILGGTLNPARDCGGVDCPSALYYATGPDPSCPPNGSCSLVATGAPIVINSEVTFRDGNFGDFYFFGGVEIGQAVAHFGPGRYGLFGVRDPSRTPLFNNDNAAQLLSTSADDAGRIFILSDTSYPGLERQLGAITDRKVWGGAGHDELFFSRSSIKSGNNASSRVDLYGLDKDALPLGETVLREKFNSVLLWQDQRNSYVGYDDGGVNLECGGLNTPCPGGATPPSDSPQLEIWATPYAHFEGTIYQPRGAWTVLQAAGDYVGPLRIITGAMELQGSGRLTLTGEAPPIIRYTTALIE